MWRRESSPIGSIAPKGLEICRSSNSLARSFPGMEFPVAMPWFQSYSVLKSIPSVKSQLLVFHPLYCPSFGQRIYILQRGKNGNGCSTIAVIGSSGLRVSNPLLCTTFIHPYAYNFDSYRARKPPDIHTKFSPFDRRQENETWTVAKSQLNRPSKHPAAWLCPSIIVRFLRRCQRNDIPSEISSISHYWICHRFCHAHIWWMAAG